MQPFEFSVENAMEIIPDSRRRILESEARKFADAGLSPRTLFKQGKTPWDYVVKQHERLVWRNAYTKRKARIARMSEARK